MASRYLFFSSSLAFVIISRTSSSGAEKLQAAIEARDVHGSLPSRVVLEE